MGYLLLSCALGQCQGFAARWRIRVSASAVHLLFLDIPGLDAHDPFRPDRLMRRPLAALASRLFLEQLRSATRTLPSTGQGRCQGFILLRHKVVKCFEARLLRVGRVGTGTGSWLTL